VTSTVSVALASYNGERFLERQLASILAQSVLPSEVVISDDGSDDRTPDIMAEFAETATARGVDIRLLRATSAERGVTANFERACSACTGELILLCDQDDEWPPQKVERLVAEFASRPDLLLLFSDATLIDGSGAELESTLFRRLEVSRSELDAVHRGDAFSALLRRNLVTGATVAFRRTLLESALPFAGEWVHDEWLAVIAGSLAGVDALEEPLLRYRLHESNQIGAQDPTLRRKVRRVLESRGSRTAELADRTAVLAIRLAALPVERPPLAAAVPALIAKEAFERRRSRLPVRRIARLREIAGMLRAGDYATFASRGRADAIRDLLQAP